MLCNKYFKKRYRNVPQFRAFSFATSLMFAFAGLSCMPIQQPRIVAGSNIDVINKLYEPPPINLEVVNLNPSLLRTQEENLRKQLQAGRVASSLLQNAATIALQASAQSTRLAAIESIGYREYGDGEETMIRIFETLKDENEKSAALNYIHVNSITSPEAGWMIAKLNSNSVSDKLKEQMIDNLSLGALIEQRGDKNVASILQAKIPTQWQDAVVRSIDKLTQYRSASAQPPALKP